MSLPQEASEEPPFWQRPLATLSREQWERLCDRCAKCCLHSLEERGSRRVYFTNVACRLLDLQQCRCRDYPNRSAEVPRCRTLTPELLADPYWLPDSCAYRRLAEGKPLPEWHPLRSGRAESVAESGNCVCGRVVREQQVKPAALKYHLIDWVRC